MRRIQAAEGGGGSVAVGCYTGARVRTEGEVRGALAFNRLLVFWFRGIAMK